MNTVKLFGGLGNQLFQYSYGLSCRMEGKRVNFLLAPEYGCLTDVFKLEDASILEIRNLIVSVIIKAWAKFVIHSYETGFFQEYRYAVKARENCRFEFSRAREYATSAWSARMEGEGSVSVHIRGGDYLAGGMGGMYGSVCGPAYYSQSFEMLARKLSSPLFYVFTNDPAHARRILQKCRFKYHLVFDDYFSRDPGFDMYLMSLCTNHIIANSTFSWWGAFLGQQSSGFTICPDRWNSADTVDLDQLIPPTWLRVPSDASYGFSKQEKDET